MKIFSKMFRRNHNFSKNNRNKIIQFLIEVKVKSTFFIFDQFLIILKIYLLIELFLIDFDIIKNHIFDILTKNLQILFVSEFFQILIFFQIGHAYIKNLIKNNLFQIVQTIKIIEKRSIIQTSTNKKQIKISTIFAKFLKYSSN